MENFERAAQTKLRFESNSGLLSAEDLFDLSLGKLDEMAKEVNAALQAEQATSFIPNSIKRTTSLDANQLRLDILVRVITIKCEQVEARKDAAAKRAQLEHLKEIRDAKSIEAIANQGLEEINKQIAELEASGVV